MNSSQKYVSELIQIGRKVCCFENSQKQTEVMTVPQQETLTAHLLSEEDGITVSDLIKYDDEYKILGFLKDFLLDGNERNAHNLLVSLKDQVVMTFYKRAEELFKTELEKQAIDQLKAAGYEAKQCEQTGETLWV